MQHHDSESSLALAPRVEETHRPAGLKQNLLDAVVLEEMVEELEGVHVANGLDRHSAAVGDDLERALDVFGARFGVDQPFVELGPRFQNALGDACERPRVSERESGDVAERAERVGPDEQARAVGEDAAEHPSVDDQLETVLLEFQVVPERHHPAGEATGARNAPRPAAILVALTVDSRGVVPVDEEHARPRLLQIGGDRQPTRCPRADDDDVEVRGAHAKAAAIAAVSLYSRMRWTRPLRSVSTCTHDIV